MDKYLYPALFEPNGDGYSVSFPDLPGCVSYGASLDEALDMAKEALELHMFDMEETSQELPKPTLPQEIALGKGEFTSMITAWMPPVRDEIENQTIKKTLTLPYWANRAGEEKGINFSKALLTGVKLELGIYDRASQ